MALASSMMDWVREAFRGKPPQVDDQNEFLSDAADMGVERLAGYATYDRWYDGDHNTKLLARAKLILEQAGIPFSENFCETIVDVHQERLQVVGFRVQDNEPASEWLTSTWWPRAGLDEKQGTIHHDLLKKGDGFLIVEPRDEGVPAACYNRPEIIKPVYDDDGDELLYVSKCWPTSKITPTNPDGKLIRRLTLFYPDRIEKWFTDSSGDDAVWAPALDRGDVDERGVPQWPIPWTESGLFPTDGQAEDAIGINVFHYRHKAKGRTFGRSLLRGVIPQNAALDKQVLDLFYVMDSQGWKQRWAAGVPDGTSLAVAIGEWVRSSNHETKFGEFSAEDPTKLVETIEGTLRRMSARSRTPLHDLLIKGEVPSGEALKSAETGLVKATEDRWTPTGDTHSNAAAMAWKLDGLFGKSTGAPPFDPDAEINVDWAPAETRNDRLEAETLLIHGEMGVSNATRMRKLGYDPEEEAKLRDAEAKADAARFPMPSLVSANGDDPVAAGQRPAGGTKE